MSIVAAAGMLAHPNDAGDSMGPPASKEQQLSTWLEHTLGGTAEQISLAKSPDHLTLVISIIPLMRIAGGKWAELVKDMP